MNLHFTLKNKLLLCLLIVGFASHTQVQAMALQNAIKTFTSKPLYQQDEESNANRVINLKGACCKLILAAPSVVIWYKNSEMYQLLDYKTFSGMYSALSSSNRVALCLSAVLSTHWFTAVALGFVAEETVNYLLKQNIPCTQWRINPFKYKNKLGQAHNVDSTTSVLLKAAYVAFLVYHAKQNPGSFLHNAGKMVGTAALLHLAWNINGTIIPWQKIQA